MDHGLDGSEAVSKQTQFMHVFPDRYVAGDQMDLVSFRLKLFFCFLKLRNCSACQYQDHILVYISGGLQPHAASASGDHTNIRHLPSPSLIVHSIFAVNSDLFPTVGNSLCLMIPF